MSDSDGLAAFVLRAERATYAAQGDEASVTPLLPGARQLEYREGDLFVPAQRAESRHRRRAVPRPRAL